MICPKCEEGTIRQIVFRKDGKKASLCNFCDALWFEGETIGILSNRTLRSFSDSQGREYTIEEIDEKDQDHQPINRSK